MTVTVATRAMQAGRLEVETVMRAPLVVVGDPVVIASGVPVRAEELGGGGVALLERPAGTVLAFVNPDEDTGLFVWAARSFLAVVAEPDSELPLLPVGALTLVSGLVVAGPPGALAGWGEDVEPGDGAPARARMHRGRHRLGLIVVARCPAGDAAVAAGRDAAAVRYLPETDF